jgi:hypothetical protein
LVGISLIDIVTNNKNSLASFSVPSYNITK